MTLQEFYDKLEYHDWYSHMSDDYSVFLEGERNKKQLERISKQSKEHTYLYNRYKKYVYSLSPWNNEEELPKPERPE